MNNQYRFFKEEHRIIISQKWANKRIDCTLHGIINGCNGACCKNKKFWPPSSTINGCPYLKANGCILSIHERPLTCLLYPFKIKNDKMILYGKSLLHTCKKNYKKDDNNVKTIFENIKDGLIEIFGKDEYEMSFNFLIKKRKDYAIKIPKWAERQLALEKSFATKNIVPIKRINIHDKKS